MIRNEINLVYKPEVLGVLGVRAHQAVVLGSVRLRGCARGSAGSGDSPPTQRHRSADRTRGILSLKNWK